MLLESPSDPRVQQEVDETFAAARVSLRPYDFKSKGNTHIGGHYGIARSTGLTTGIAAAGALASLRWTQPDRGLLLQRIRAFAVIDTAFTTAQEVAVDLVRVKHFTASDTGGTAVTLGDEGKKSPNMGASLITDFRIATTAALGAGTGTEEANPLSALVLPIGNVVGAAAGGVLYEHEPGFDVPATLARIEGFRIRNRFAQGAAGVVRFTFTFDWLEVPTNLLGL